jgi:hypothetical protein
MLCKYLNPDKDSACQPYHSLFKECFNLTDLIMGFLLRINSDNIIEKLSGNITKEITL